MTNSTSISEPEIRYRRIRRIAGVMTVVCSLLALLLLPCMIAVWSFVEHIPRMPLPAKLLHNLSLTDRIGAIAISMLAAGLAAWGLVSLAQLFARFRQGDVFDLRATILLRRFALSVLLLPVAQAVVEASTTAWLSRNTAPGEGVITISLSSDGILFFVIGVLLMTVAWVFHDAAAIAEDNRMIV